MQVGDCRLFKTEQRARSSIEIGSQIVPLHLRFQARKLSQLNHRNHFDLDHQIGVGTNPFTSIVVLAEIGSPK